MGAMTGMKAAYVDADGFTSAPAQLLKPIGAGGDVWADPARTLAEIRTMFQALPGVSLDAPGDRLI